MSTTEVIRIDNLSKRFVIRKEKSLKERVVNFGRSNLHKDDFWALSDVNVSIRSGETVGLVGPNGSGKSTLLKMIGGILQPTSGTVQLRGRLAALLELGAGFHPDLTGRENVYLNASILGISRQQTDRYFDAIVDFSGIEQFIDTQVKFYSSGMYVRLAFAVAVHVDPDILLVDEVLAVGDEPFQRKCLERVRQFQHEGRTIVLVTHSLDQVADFCDRAIVLEKGRVVADDVPRVALPILRRDFEATRQEDVDRAQERAVGPDAVAARARIDSVTLTSGQQAVASESATITPGDAVTAHVQVTAEEPLEDWVLGIGVDTPLGTSVFGTNTKFLDVRMPRLVGTGSYAFKLDDVALGEGAYNVHAALALTSGTELHRLTPGAGLTVVGDGTSQGHVHINTAFEIDEGVPLS
ncbi:ABC transporter ATP-binding protein [Cellulomonas chengniuliangii]|uniref:ABC transporter ATP-binding protein n=1 Tax=Cellulomonas chengniuliangii TaxID=2968084 RepID=A0ABY5KVR4_9CELL|nr:ABC transporter ATP-binding protein [Cellulomonas chengniuliangii]MCC2308724.1 ABC transporter ATP-binding protein [Cellulomonas chengniuliangii]UUI74524.1 ABC transporter ATP-binding protein [Cellulomonas chengniuliangii]